MQKANVINKRYNSVAVKISNTLAVSILKLLLFPSFVALSTYVSAKVLSPRFFVLGSFTVQRLFCGIYLHGGPIFECMIPRSTFLLPIEALVV